MSLKNKVVWSQGLFVQPQHFQQQTRYLESVVDQKTKYQHSYDWGVYDICFDKDLLSQGRLGLYKCLGRFPDGTAIQIYDGDSKPGIREIPELQNVEVFLALPLSRPGNYEIDLSNSEEGLAREIVEEVDVKDNIAGMSGVATMFVAKLNYRLLLEHENRSEFTCIGIGRILERRPDGTIVMDEDYVAPSLNVGTVKKLKRYLEEVVGLLTHRAEALAHRVSDGKTGSAEITDFIFLQTVNRYLPLFQHFNSMPVVHPESLYTQFLQLSGELATFTRTSRRPTTFTEYDHTNLQKCFKNVVLELRENLSTVLEQNVINMPIESKKYGIYVSQITDSSIVRQSYFILAARANIPDDLIRKQLPQQMKIGPVEKIRDLVNLQLPGVGFRAMAAPPRQIPFHSGFTYFELDKNSELWALLGNSGGFAFHVSGDYPGLDLELWAIKG